MNTHFYPILLSSLLLSTVVLAAPTITVRATTPDHIIGHYELHPDTAFAARSGLCPDTLTFRSYVEERTESPSSIEHPAIFPFRIRHWLTSANNHSCESSGSILAAHSDDVLNQEKDVLKTWAAAGKKDPPFWLNDKFISNAAKHAFAMGIDLTQRSCHDKTLKAGIGYLWIQPSWIFPLTNLKPGFSLRDENKYLILTFASDRHSGCVYTAKAVGGEAGFSTGPATDPSKYYSPSPVPEKPTATESPEETLSPTASPSTSSSPTSVPSPTPSTPSTPSASPSNPPIRAPPTTNAPPVTSTRTNRVFASSGPNNQSKEADEPACFPASARVRLHNGASKPIGHLQISDTVHVGGGEVSQIFFFTHRKAGLHRFMKIVTACSTLTISPGHYVYRGSTLVAARHLRVGDVLTASDGRSCIVSGISETVARGLYAPHTLHGDLVVDEIVVSTYTTAVHPQVAHVLLAPIRLMYRVGLQPVYQRVADSGGSALEPLLPSGPTVYRT